MKNLEAAHIDFFHVTEHLRRGGSSVKNTDEEIAHDLSTVFEQKIKKYSS